MLRSLFFFLLFLLLFLSLHLLLSWQWALFTNELMVVLTEWSSSSHVAFNYTLLTLFSLKQMYYGIFLGLLITLSFPVWPLIWLGFELNIICFLSSFFKDSKAQALIYFIVQRVGSILVLGSSLFSESKTSFLILIILGFILKLGAAPLHFWLPILLPRLPLIGLYIVIRFQKMAPLFLLANILLPKDIISFSNIFLGAIIMISLASPLIVLIFSRISQIGLMFLLSLSVLKNYMTIYFIILVPLILFLFSSSRNFFLGILNVAGLPPFSGFFIKLKAILSLSKIKSFFLLLASAITLASYSRIILNSSYRKDELSFVTIVSLFIGIV